MIRAVLYDFDGTLGDSLADIAACYRAALLACGVDAPFDTMVANCFNKSHIEAAASFGVDLATFTAAYNAALAEYTTVELFPEVLAVFSALQQRRIPIGIGTMRNRQYLDPLISQLPDIRATVTHDEVTKKKPDPETFLLLCQKLAVRAQEVIVVGDHSNDIFAAREMGATSALFFTTDHERYYTLTEAKAWRPDYLIEKHTELISIIDKLNVTRETT